MKCLVYLDIIVYGETLQIHNDKLREVFARLRLHNLKLQPDKCEFLRKEVTYLGHKLTALGLRPDPEKVSAVKKTFLLPQILAKSNNIWAYAGIIENLFQILAAFQSH